MRKMIGCILTLLSLSLMAALLVSTSQAAPELRQCAPRTDWTTYTVQRGDTLASIARRFNTTPSELVAGNCLPNANRIFTGQVLRVPNAPGIPSGTTQTIITAGTVQSFDNGFMLWRGDTGDIWVLSNDTQARGFLSASYAYLPDNPVKEVSPAERFKPEFGFGKVWGNFPDVRRVLGWAILGERSVQVTIANGYFSLILPDGRYMVIRPTLAKWSFEPVGTIPPTVTPAPQPTTAPPGSTPISLQAFEHGLMVWRASTGDILALNFNGTYATYASATYARLPDNPVPDVPPGGLVKPILGFGKVWGNFGAVRAALGWATNYEQSLAVTITGTPYPITIALPGTRSPRSINLTSATTWQYLESGTPITPVPAPTLDPRIPATYLPFEKGFMVWRADTNDIWVFYGQQGGAMASYPAASYGTLPDNPVTAPPPTNLFRPIYGFGKVWGNFPDVRAGLGWAITSGELAYRLTYHTVQGGQGFTINLPDGRTVNMLGSTWNF